MESSQVVVSVDGGGTHCRAICSNLWGNVLSYAVGQGTNPEHNPNACETARTLIQDVLNKADRKTCDVNILVAGLSGLDHPHDLKWAAEFTTLPGLECERLLLNDAQIAHAGALRGKPGIVAVLGTGAMIWAITEAGEDFRDYDFGYYSAAASRHFTFAAVHTILCDEQNPPDPGFEKLLFNHLDVANMNELRTLAATYIKGDNRGMKQTYGRLAKVITQKAVEGSPLPLAICERMASQIVTSFGILSGCFQAQPVKVAVVGGVGRCEFMRKRLPEVSAERFPGRFAFEEPDLSPLAGGVLLGLERLGRVSAESASNLRSHPAGRFSE